MTTALTSVKVTQNLTSLLNAIEACRELDPEMPAQAIITFILVANRPGITLGELTTRLNLSQSAASRNVFALSRDKGKGVMGLDLVETREDPMNRRIKHAYLTSKGERFARKLAELLD